MNSEKIFKSLEQFLHEPPPLAQWILSPLRLLVLIVRQFLVDRCLQRASSLAYTTLLSLIPLFVVFFIFFRFTPTYETLEESIMDFFLKSLPLASESIVRQTFSDFLGKISAGKIGVLGFFVFLITSISLLATIERSLNTIWKVDEHRRFISRFMAYWVILTLGPILVGVSIYFSSQMNLVASLRATGPSPLLWEQMIPYIFSIATAFLAYLLIPHTKVKVWSAFLGGVFAGTLWEWAKFGFGYYIREIAVVHKIFGALGLIPVFLLWLFLTWAIVLLGAELTYCLQNHQRLIQKRFRLREGAVYLEYAALRVVLEIGRRFSSGATPADEILLSEEAEIPLGLVNFVCTGLEDARLLVRAGTEQSQWIPARDLAHMEMNDIIDAVRKRSAKLYPLPQDREAHYFEDLLENVDKKARELLSGLTLQQTLQDLDPTLMGKST